MPLMDPSKLHQLASEWDPAPFQQALDSAATQSMAQPPVMMPPAVPQVGANPGAAGPAMPGGFNFAQMLGGQAQGMMQPAAAPAPVAVPPAPRPMPMMNPQPMAVPGQVPNLAAILGGR